MISCPLKMKETRSVERLAVLSNISVTPSDRAAVNRITEHCRTAINSDIKKPRLHYRNHFGCSCCHGCPALTCVLANTRCSFHHVPEYGSFIAQTFCIYWYMQPQGHPKGTVSTSNLPAVILRINQFPPGKFRQQAPLTSADSLQHETSHRHGAT